MKKINLCGSWTAHGGEFKDIDAKVPGCIHTDLMDNGLIDDPYYRDNETHLMWIGETDWSYEREFEADAELLECANIKLVCYGLDTFAGIYLNGEKVAETDNQFRTWEFDVKPYIKEGANSISVTFKSTYPYMEEKMSERWLNLTGIDQHRIKGSNYVRKSQCNYGWDWGPMCVTAGIWRDIEIQGYNEAKIADVYIAQEHEADSVTLDVKTALHGYSGAKLQLEVSVLSEGDEVVNKLYDINGETLAFEIQIDNPKLWWPNNLGDQNLYHVRVALLGGDGEIIDEKEKRIGLRTLVLDRHKDEWGESFWFKVNGVPFFAKGANWIPIDTFITRAGDDFYRHLLTDAKDANMNFVRVWGGGIYEQDILYDLCDELGLCVWQDFMFACSAYPAYDKEWIATFTKEAEDNIKRLRHHACIAMWCGNNEIEQMGFLVTEEADEKMGTMSWAEYKLVFEDIIPNLIKENDAQRDYWISSPYTPGENRKDTNDPTCGDAHLWSVWHGREPFEWYRTCEHRFNSEFGFQSFPEPCVVNSFTLPEDRNITSYVMEKHQRSGIGNDAILQYMLSWFKLPTCFDMLMWTSQILQSLAIKYAVEHWRRKMPQGMGTLYWQLNDCWPVASWSSIDYIGNWKALHYSAKRFFDPILISAVEDKEKLTAEIYLTNDTLEDIHGKAVWKLIKLDGSLADMGELPAEANANSSVKVSTLELREAVEKAGGIREVVLFFAFIADGKELSLNTLYFERPKHLKLQKPNISYEAIEVKKGEFHLTLKTDKPALWVWPELDGIAAKYSDRFFDLNRGEEKTITIKVDAKTTLDKLIHKIRVYSIYDTYQ